MAGTIALQTSYIDPDGVTWEWSDVQSGAFVISVAGIGSAPSAPAKLRLSTGDVLVQGVAPADTPIVVGLYVYDDDQATLLARLDAIANALSHDRAGQFVPGTLRFQRPDGTMRQINVACTSGPDLPDDDGGGFRQSATFGLTFDKLSPFFEDTEPTIITIMEAPTGGGVPPMPPVLLTPSTVIGVTEVDNTGDADAWPVWTITGPGTPTLTNSTTGRSFSFTTALGAGEQRIVDTRPGMVSAVDQSGNDWWGDLVKTSPRDLWQLIRGVNDLNLALLGATSDSSIQLAYARRWRRA